MQVLMTQDAWSRIRERLAALSSNLQVVTITASGTFAIDGRPAQSAEVDPEAIWLSSDAFQADLVPIMSERVMASAAARWVQSASAGVDRPMFRVMMAKGVRLSKSNAQAAPIAEYVVGHALSLLLPIDAQRAAQTAHEWRPTPYREVAAGRWVMVGYGAIGHEIAHRAKAFGVHLTVVRRTPEADDLVDRQITQAGLPAALPDADVVVLACALNEETRGLADADFFAAMKPGAILINIGRGALVDEDALRSGLAHDQPGNAVLDVFATEPLPRDSWLWDHPKVRVSAHTSNRGDGTLGRGDVLFVENLRRYLAREPLLNEATPREVGLAQ